MIGWELHLTVAPTWPSDWSVFESFSFGSAAYRYVDGTEVNPVMPCAGATRISTMFAQFSNVRASNPIGRHGVYVDSVSPTTLAGFETLFDNSRVLNIFVQAGSGAPTMPSGWSRLAGGTAASDYHLIDSKTFASKGSSTGNWVSTTSAFSHWMSLVELRGS